LRYCGTDNSLAKGRPYAGLWILKDQNKKGNRLVSASIEDIIDWHLKSIEGDQKKV